MKLTDKIFIAGHKGLVGSALYSSLKNAGYQRLIVRTRNELDLMNQSAVNNFFAEESPEFVFLAAARVGGIHANNTFRAEFIYQNLAIQTNVIDAAYRYKVKKLLFLGSSCIYPRECPQPIKEEYLLSAPLEPTNEPYAIAKIAGIKMCEAYNDQYGTNFISVMPTNLYGPYDRFHQENSHVLPALIQKIHEAKIHNQPHVTLWGSGMPKREFLYIDDMAAACIFIMKKMNLKQMINIGSGIEICIKDVAQIICDIIGFKGKINYDSSRPDGSPRKLLDISLLSNLGWRPQIDLKTGLAQTYEWYLNQQT